MRPSLVSECSHHEPRGSCPAAAQALLTSYSALGCSHRPQKEVLQEISYSESHYPLVQYMGENANTGSSVSPPPANQTLCMVRSMHAQTPHID